MDEHVQQAPARTAPDQRLELLEIYKKDCEEMI